jgi:hypothetical protein
VGVSTTSALPYLGSLLLASASVLGLDAVGVSVGILLRGLGGSLIRCLGGSLDDLGDFLEVTVLVLGTVLGLGPVGVSSLVAMVVASFVVSVEISLALVISTTSGRPR